MIPKQAKLWLDLQKGELIAPQLFGSVLPVIPQMLVFMLFSGSLFANLCKLLFLQTAKNK